MNLHRRPLGDGRTRYRVHRFDWADLFYRVALRLAIAVLISFAYALYATGVI